MCTCKFYYRPPQQVHFSLEFYNLEGNKKEIDYLLKRKFVSC